MNQTRRVEAEVVARGSRSFLRAALVIALLPLFGRSAPGCATPVPVTTEEICDDARRGIALRTQSCTDDVELANRRYDLAKTALRCRSDVDPSTAGYECSSQVLATSCEEVSTFGDDLAAWAASNPCKQIFGEVLSQDPNNPTIKQACTNDGSNCTCRIVEGAKNVGECTAPPTGEGQLPSCCASEGYPTRGSCVCSAIFCIANGSEGNRSCQCGPKPFGFGAPSLGCSPLTFPELAKGVCCLALGNQGCTCTDRTSCGSEETQVGSCESATFCTRALGAERVQVAKCSL